MSHFDVILSGPWGAFGVSVATENEAKALADTFSTQKTQVEIFEIQTQTYQEAAKEIADFMKASVRPLLKGQTK